MVLSSKRKRNESYQSFKTKLELTEPRYKDTNVAQTSHPNVLRQKKKKKVN